jgi:hypothetical protein
MRIFFYKFPTDINRGMKWWSNKSIIIVILFIGILLLLLGYFYFGYDKEGFQTASGTVNVCLTGTNEQKCNSECITDPLPPATSDEEQSYSIYQSKNLIDTYEDNNQIYSDLTFPPVFQPTNIAKYNSGGALTSFDIDLKKEIPWDFDNKDLDPANSLFGSICSEASQLIFTKCQMQEIFGDINNINYDPNEHVFKYKSQLFGSTVYNQNEATALQFGEIFINLKLGEIMGMVFNQPFEWAENYVTRKYEAQVKLRDQIADYKESLLQNGGNKDLAAQQVITNYENGKYDKQWHAEQEKYAPRPGTDDPPASTKLSELDKVTGVDDLKRGPVPVGRDAVDKRVPNYVDFSDPNKVRADLEKYKNLLLDEDLKNKTAEINRTADKKTIPMKQLSIIRSIDAKINNSNKVIRNTSAGDKDNNAGFSDLTFLDGNTRQNAKNIASKSMAAKLVKKLITRKIAEVIYNALMVAIGIAAAAAYALKQIPLATFLTGLLTTSTTVFLLLIFIQIACMTFVPAIFSSFIEYDAKCPLNSDGSEMFNFDDCFYNNKTEHCDFSGIIGGTMFGHIFYSLLQALPAFGDLLTAFGPYLCYSKQGDVKLKANLKSPPYYYDPTLSLYNAGSKPRFRAAKSYLDQRLFNPLTFHYNKDISRPKDKDGKAGYPVWVDFANPIMLDKMAQFYYDASRRCYRTTEDGMLAFQYISKFYGLISTTELTCDVQCEITEVKFDPLTGAKICEVIIPIDPGNYGTKYHDRRFYFYKDMGKAVVNRMNQIDQTNTIALQALMEDNLNIYTVTGCTNTDGTAPDCMTYNSEGNSVSNPVISLGPPSGVYNGPLVDIGNTNNIPQESTCGKNRNFARYNGISHPANSKSSNTNNADIKIITNPIENKWEYSYKYSIANTDDRDDNDNQKYYYPSKNVEDIISNKPGIEVVKASDTLRTTKYMTIVWSQKCNYDDTECQINSKNGQGTIVQGTMEGLVGLGFGIGQIQQGYTRNQIQSSTTKFSKTFTAAATILPLAGAIAQGTMGMQFPGQEMSASQQMSCLYEDIVNEDGTYILNGRVMTSKPGYVMDQGPFINWAPGYIPTIRYCNKQTIELFDCVNPYAVRRFINMYHTQNADQNIKKINKIIPTLNTGTKWDVNNSKAMCIYDIDIVRFDNVNFKEIPNTTQTKQIGLLQKQNVTDKTCTFVPDRLINNKAELFSPQTFVKNAVDEPVLPIKAINLINNKTYIITKVGTTRWYDIGVSLPSDWYNTAKTNWLNSLSEVARNAINAARTTTAVATVGFSELIGGMRDLYEPSLDPNEWVPPAVGTFFTKNNNNATGDGVAEERKEPTPLLDASSATTSSNIFLALKNIRDNDIRAIDAIASIDNVDVKTLSPTIPLNIYIQTMDKVVLSPEAKFNCSSSTKQAELITKFNLVHLDIPKLKSISEAWNMKTFGNMNYCFFKGEFEIIDIKLRDGLNLTGPVPITISRNFKIFLDNDGNYSFDDFPIFYTHVPIPKPSQWFDVPPRIQNITRGSFPRPGCSEDPVYNDCSNVALIDILVKQYNTQKTDSKILKVWRAFTTDISTTDTRKCDYDVEILKTVGGKTIFNRETVRFSLTSARTQAGSCIYNLDLDATIANLRMANSGSTLNLSNTTGMLKTPYTTAIAYSKKTQEDTISAIRNYLGYNIASIVKSTTTDILNRLQGVRESLYRDGTLFKCPSKTCMDDTIIKAMINRYNYDNYPVYPPNQNTVTKKTIIRVTKVGTSTPKQCQVELYLRTDFFVDFLYNPLTEDINYYMHNYVFNLIETSTQCKFKVKPFTKIDIDENRMDISGDAFSLKCPAPPATCPSIITNSSSASYKFVTEDYNEVMIRCDITDANNPVLQTVKNIYDTTVIFTKLNTKYYNKILTVTRVFNAKPNILEFKVSCKRVYWDDTYNIAYYTGDSSDNIEESYLKVVWPEDTSYEVETGYYWKDSAGVFVEAPTSNISYVNGVAKSGNLTMATPIIEEIFYPDLIFTNTNIFRKDSNGEMTEVFLPYLANDGLTPVDSRQTRKYRCNPANCS